MKLVSLNVGRPQERPHRCYHYRGGNPAMPVKPPPPLSERGDQQSEIQAELSLLRLKRAVKIYLMQFVKCPVSTLCMGLAASMGAVLLTAGAKGKRNALPHARVLIHQPLAGTEGTTSDILIHAKEFLRLKKDLNEILLKHTGQTLERIEKDTDRDKFMSPQEAVDYGIVDKVLQSRALAE